MSTKEPEDKFLSRMAVAGSDRASGYVEVPAGDFRRLLAIARRYRRMDAEAAEHVESVICMRSHRFTGEEPYIGWRGLGQALREDYDELNMLRNGARALIEADRAVEREMCAKVAEGHQAQYEGNQTLATRIGKNIAAAIRARGEPTDE